MNALAYRLFRLTSLLACAALALLLPVASALADAPDFRFRQLLAGKASLTETGFVVRRGLGSATFLVPHFSSLTSHPSSPRCGGKVGAD